MSINNLNNQNAEIYGGDLDMVAVAPFGTELPVGMADLAAPFKDLGWLSEDGVDWDDDVDTTDVKGHQGGRIVIKIPSSVSRTFKVQCLEETALTVGLRYPGWKPTEVAAAGGAPASYGGLVPGPTMDPHAYVLDMNSITNAGHRKRYVVPNGVVTDMATISNKRSDVALYEFTVEALEGLVYLYFSGNQAAFKQA